ncbi:MAG TPA: dockerin type I repeat-containing protein [Armatimonadota bacterium]|jgi:hypothetical protein
MPAPYAGPRRGWLGRDSLGALLALVLLAFCLCPARAAAPLIRQWTAVTHKGAIWAFRNTGSAIEYTCYTPDSTGKPVQTAESVGNHGWQTLPIAYAGTAAFPVQAVSDDLQYLYLFRQSTGGKILMDKLVTKADGTVAPALEVRNNGTEEAPDWDFRDKSGNLYYTRTQELSSVQVADGCFAVVRTPAVIQNEFRWNILALPSGKASTSLAIHSYRVGTNGMCDTNATTVVTGASAGAVTSSTFEGYVTETVPLSSFQATTSLSRPGAISYATKETVNGKVVKTGLKVMVGFAGQDEHLRIGHLRVLASGVVTSVGMTAASITLPGLETHHPEVVVDGPNLLESGDGTVRARVLSTEDKSWGFYDSVYTYDPLTQEWTHRNGAEWDTSFGASPMVEAELATVSGAPPATTGTIRRLSIPPIGERLDDEASEDQRFEWRFSRVVGSLKAIYVGEALINESIIGYVEGPPPVPAANFLPDKDYANTSYANFSTTSSSGNNWSYNRDRGINANTSGSGLGVAWDVSMKYGWLDGSTMGTTESLTRDVTAGLQGQVDPGTHLFQPLNYGTAVVEGARVDVYGLSLSSGTGGIIAYTMVPKELSNGGKARRILPFRIDPNYLRVGDLESYKKTDVVTIENQIDRRQKEIEAYYQAYNANAFASMPPAERVTHRNLINNYSWDARIGSYKESRERSYAQSSSLGGAIDTTAMFGVGFNVSVGLLVQQGSDCKILAGGHAAVTLTKGQTDSDSISVDLNMMPESADVLTTSGAYKYPGQKVAAYTYSAYLLESDVSHFNEFFSRAIDKRWLIEDTSDAASRLRQIIGRNNPAWRLTYRVLQTDYSGAAAPGAPVLSGTPPPPVNDDSEKLPDTVPDYVQAVLGRPGYPGSVVTGTLEDLRKATLGTTVILNPQGEVLKGDVNGDGLVSISDVMLLLRALVGLGELDAVQIAAADADGDGRILANDITRILWYAYHAPTAR